MAPVGPLAGRWRTVGYSGGVVEALLALDAAGDTLLLGDGNGGRISRTTNGGASWSTVNGGIGGQITGPKTPDGFCVLPAGHPRAGRLLAGGVLLASDDRGATWTEATQDIPLGSQSAGRTFAALPSGRVLAGTSSGVMVSDDAGTSYVRSPLWGTFVIESLVAFATPGSVQSGAPACGLPDGALCDGALALGFSSQLPDIRAWRTNDGGRTWSPSVALPEPYDGVANGYTAGVAALAPGPGGLGRAVTVLGRGLVYATSDGGQTWAAVGRLPVSSVGHSTQQARLGTDGHLWVSTTMNGVKREWLYRTAEAAEAAFAVAGEASPEPAGAVGVSVWPNPARGRVEVSVTLAEAGPVRVVVFDALGRAVAVVLDGAVSGGGTVAAIETGAWPAGVYVVRASAGAREATARLVVAR